MNQRQRNLLDGPTSSEAFANVIEGSATAFSSAQLAPVSGRLPVYIVARLDAMATRAGKSRNAMLNMVVEAGLESIQAHLSDEVLEELRFLESDALSCTLSKPTTSGEVY